MYICIQFASFASSNTYTLYHYVYVHIKTHRFEHMSKRRSNSSRELTGWESFGHGWRRNVQIQGM